MTTFKQAFIFGSVVVTVTAIALGGQGCSFLDPPGQNTVAMSVIKDLTIPLDSLGGVFLLDLSPVNDPEFSNIQDRILWVSCDSLKLEANPDSINSGGLAIDTVRFSVVVAAALSSGIVRDTAQSLPWNTFLGYEIPYYAELYKLGDAIAHGDHSVGVILILHAKQHTSPITLRVTFPLRVNYLP